jgi:acyl-homoserine lactone synthase
MDLRIIQGAEAHRHADLLDGAFRLRHEIFIVERNWRSLRSVAGREVDDFDHDDARHFVIVESGRVAVYSRLLPTTGPHLLADIYPHLVVGEPPRGPSIWEWTRMCVAPWFRDRRPSGFHHMARFVIAHALAEGIEQLSIQAHPDWILSFERIGVRSRPLGLPAILDGELVVPFVLRIEPPDLDEIDHAIAVMQTSQRPSITR